MSKSVQPRFLRSLMVLASVVVLIATAGAGLVWFTLRSTREDDIAIARACAEMVKEGLPNVAVEQSQRFLGKVSAAKLECSGGALATTQHTTPWVDWGNYWGAGDLASQSDRFTPASHIFNRSKRGIDGALVDLEIQRMELIKFNLFDNKTYRTFAKDPAGPILKVWPEMELPETDPQSAYLGRDAEGRQLCQRDQIRFRTLTGICNDIRNPAMGAAGQLFSRNVAFEATFPDLGLNELARNRHGDRIALLKPDPQVLSRRLFTRSQSATPDCNQGLGSPRSNHANCSYRKAPNLNVMAAFWIQFMTHDWFSHLDEARNDQSLKMTDLGCTEGDAFDGTAPAVAYGCRPGDTIDAALFVDTATPGTFPLDGVQRLQRAPKTSANTVTAWWDASQIYGWNETSQRRVSRDPQDRAKLLLLADKSAQRYLPVFRTDCPDAGSAANCEPIQPEWTGQEAVAFPDNWSLGLSFYHNLFAREHNAIVDEFRRLAIAEPGLDSGLRNPQAPDAAIPFDSMTDDELYAVTRLIVSAEIAKIHTIEWTTQLLYNKPLHEAMNSNWSGLFEDFPLVAEVSDRLVKRLSGSSDPVWSNQLYSAFAAGSGIVGRGNHRKFPPYFPDWLSWDRWSIANPDDVNGGTNHFGSPFNFPEAFPSVYRLHALIPDMLEYRDLDDNPNAIQEYLPIIETFRGRATDHIHRRGLANVGLTMGRQRLGLLVLQNHPQFLQNLDLRPGFDSAIDVIGLDIIRDRERGTPRFNEFRRQIGLRQLTGFEDFIDRKLPPESADRIRQAQLVEVLRDIYGTHVCDVRKIITDAQLTASGEPINDCLGHHDGSVVDNIEDLDLVVGFHAESTRPHGFAISETQFQIFILNASRRLFSDRFFTSSFRPEFYTTLGIEWVANNGPTGEQWEANRPDGDTQQVSPLKRILLRAMPELEPEMRTVVNAFDPWARERGNFYALDWKPRSGAVEDPAFAIKKLSLSK